MTDAQGKFVFERVEGDSRYGDGKVYVVSIRFPGYLPAHQIVDLTANPRGYVNFDLRRDTSKDAPNVPEEGPGGAISAKQPSSPEAQAALGKGEELLLEKHDAKGSIEYFKKAVKLDPHFVPGNLLLGTAYMQTGAYAEAQSAFEKAAKIENSNAIALIGIGAALNEQQRWEEAQKPLLRGLELKPDSAEGQYEAARGLWALNRWQEAEPHVLKAIALNKDYPGPHVLMGNIYLRHRNANSALDEYREYLRLDPQGEQAGEVKKMVSKIEKALGQR
jgi:tetratricopeptide (TPR) repeat protein